MIHIKHCGVDAQEIGKVLESRAFREEYERLRELTEGKVVIGSFDSASPFSGIVEKLSGYTKYLDKFPKRAKELVFIQVLPL